MILLNNRFFKKMRKYVNNLAFFFLFSLQTYWLWSTRRGGVKVSKGAKIRNRYNQVPHLTKDTNGKVKNYISASSPLDHSGFIEVFVLNSICLKRVNAILLPL